MIVVTATMWPHGSQLDAKELLHATITNQTSPGEALETYGAHVTCRPNSFAGIEGFDADVSVTEHRSTDGVVPLLLATFGAAYGPLQVPPARCLARLTLREVHEFEAILRGRQ